MDYPIIPILGAVLSALFLATLLAGGIARVGFPLPSADRRIGCIDGLRGYLALTVMAHHFIIWLQISKLGGAWVAPNFHLFNQLGAGGVALFFMTTGLVFYPRILTGFSACNWRAIYTSRVFRLLPPIAMSVLLITVVIMLRTGNALTPSYIKPSLLWVSAVGEPSLLGYADSGRLNAYVLWSLHFEWLFYLAILPLCAIVRDVMRRFEMPSWLLPVALLVLSMAAVLLLKSPPLLLHFVPAFAVGMLGYECHRHAALAQRLRSPTATLAAAALLLIGMVTFATPYTAALPFFGFFFVCVACGNDFGGLLRSRGALVLGECSYSIYLLHGLTLDILYVDLAGLLHRFSASQLALLLPGVAMAMTLIGAASFLLVERPSIRLGARIVRGYTLAPILSLGKL